MKRILSIIVFVTILLITFDAMNEVFVEKSQNRYYMLSKELKNVHDVDVQVYGSCHAYTSFNSLKFSEEYGLSSYNLSNPGEIMPATYLRMSERFKKDVPEIAVIELWGVNAYETYDSSDAILGQYLQSNIENLPISKEKLEVIKDFDSLDIWAENFAVLKYKKRLTEWSLCENDFDYSFEWLCERYNLEGTEWRYNEMKSRFENRGFLVNRTNEVPDYAEKQMTVVPTETLQIEADLMKYLERIIELCQKENVKLLFYRAPYLSTENELRKRNYLEQYFEEKGLPFFDLEKELEFDYLVDFYDYWHLSETGADKATEYLGEKIMEILNDNFIS